MNRWLRNQHIAGVVGVIGGALGVIVGFIQATFGAAIPNWTGHKADPVALGVLTILLSGISVLSAVALRGGNALPPGKRLTAAVGLLLPGSLCFSTGGALWYVPGALLFTAGVYAVVAGDAHRTREVIATMWLHVLVSVLGTFEILMGVSAGPSLTIAVGVVGGVALLAAPWPPSMRLRLTLLLIGTLPFAVLTWWSVASPVVPYSLSPSASALCDVPASRPSRRALPHPGCGPSANNPTHAVRDEAFLPAATHDA